jgi:CTP:molybdopterin cytidylyltransferase MocA
LADDESLVSLPSLNTSPLFAAVIVAAGASTRLGQPKQLLVVAGQPQIVRAAEAAIRAGASPVVVVLGAYEDRIRGVLAGLPVDIVSNPRWAGGMGSSISVGTAHLITQAPQIEAALIAACDQPYLQTATIAALRSAFLGNNSIVAARYTGRLGVPVLFGRDYFEPLTKLHGDKGARQILDENAAHVIGVDLPELATDLDTWEDYQKLSAKVPTGSRCTSA